MVLPEPFPPLSNEYKQLLYQMWLADGSYTERWEQGFRKSLYHGRTGAYYQSENTLNRPFDAWTLPEILSGSNDTNEAGWKNSVRMRNAKPNSDEIDQLYFALPKAHLRQIMVFEAKLPAPTGQDGLYLGFEVNSGGSFAILVCLACISAQWQGYVMDYRHVTTGLTDNITLNKSAEWARYALVYDPPIFEIWQSTTANKNILERASRIYLENVAGKTIPFFANENSSAVKEYEVGNIWVYEIPKRQRRSHPQIKTISATAGNVVYNLSPGTGKRWTIKNGVITLANDATVATRYITVEKTDGTNILTRYPLSAGVVASATQQYYINSTGYMLSGLGVGAMMLGVPNGIVLEGADQLRITINTGQAGDSYSGFMEVLEEYV